MIIQRSFHPALLNNQVVAIFRAECPPMFGPGSRAGVMTEIVRTVTLSCYNPEHGGSLGDGRWELGERPPCSDVGTTIAGHRDFGSGQTSVQAELPKHTRPMMRHIKRARARDCEFI